MGLENITIKESGKVVWENNSYVGGVAGIISGNEDNKYIILEIGSGSYSFVMSGITPTGVK